MSTEYKTITDRVATVLNAERTDKLSENLSATVTAVKTGQYVPQESSTKPIVYIRLRRVGLIADMAGGLKRNERLMFLVSGAARGTTQQAAIDDASNLINNIENVLVNYITDSGNWGASRFGWSYSTEDERPETFGELEIEPGSDGCVVHFQLMWSCDIRIERSGL